MDCEGYPLSCRSDSASKRRCRGADEEALSVGLVYWPSARFPREKGAIRIEGLFFIGKIHAGEPGARNSFLTPRRAGAVEDHVGMMKDARISGPNLDGLHPAGGRNGNRKNE